MQQTLVPSCPLCCILFSSAQNCLFVAFAVSNCSCKLSLGSMKLTHICGITPRCMLAVGCMGCSHFVLTSSNYRLLIYNDMQYLGKQLPYDSINELRKRMADVAPHLANNDSVEAPMWLNGEYFKVSWILQFCPQSACFADYVLLSHDVNKLHM